MTVVGKILVFLNLVFSLVVGAFAVMDYTARTHWVDGFNKLNDRYAVLQGVSNTYKAEADKLAKEKQDLYERLNKSGVKGLEPGSSNEDAMRVGDRVVAYVKEQGKAIEEMRVQADDLRKREADARKKADESSTVSKVLTTDAKGQREDVSLLRKTLTTEMEKNTNLTRDVNDMRDQMVQSQIQAKTFKDRNDQLEQQLQEVAKKIVAMRPGAAGQPRGVAPPPENMEGVVRRSDGTLVTISLGSDAGLTRDHTLEVFRLGAQSRYIGKIRIVDVTPTQAVGQAVGRLAAPIQVNDRVASHILGGR